MRAREIFEAFDAKLPFDGILYHATTAKNARSCIADGVNPVSYWAVGVVSEYYIGCVEDDDDEYEAVILEAPLSAFDESQFEPDFPGLEEPVTYSINRRSDDEIWTEWEKSGKTWRDSLRIIGSVRYKGHIKPALSDGYYLD